MSAIVSTRNARNLLSGIECELGGGDVIAALRVAQEMLGAFGNPGNGTFEVFGGDRNQRIFTIGKQLRPKTAAGIWRDHAHFLDRDIQDHLAQHVANAMRALTAQRQCEPVLGFVVFRDGRAGVEIIGDQALIDDCEGDRLGGCAKGRVGLLLVPDRFLKRQVARAIRPHQRCSWCKCRHGVNNGCPRPPIDNDCFRSILGLLDGVGNNESDRIADVMDGHRVPKSRRAARGMVTSGIPKHHRQFAEVGRILAGQDQTNAWQATSLGHIGDTELRIGMGRAQHDGVQRAGRHMIGRIAPRAAQKRVVFHAQDALRNTKLDLIHQLR